jgi:hypothetical protein
MLLISLMMFSDASYDLSSTSDISQVTATREVLKVCHKVDKGYDANGSPVLSSGLTPCPRRPPKKPHYSKQCGNTNLHDMPPYEFLQARVYEMEPGVVSDDDITDDLDHSDDDIYDPSYEMDPFDISSSMDTIQTHVSKSIPRPVMNEKVCANQDKWSNINHKPKDLREQIDERYKSVKLGYIKPPSSSSFPSRPPSKPPFPHKESCDIKLHEMTTYEFYRYTLQTLHKMKPSLKNPLSLIMTF